MDYIISRSQVEQDFYNIFGKTDAFGTKYSRADIDNWIKEFQEDEALIGNKIIIQ